MRLSPFVRCTCGKLHVVHGSWRNTFCTCGVNLYVLAFDGRVEVDKERAGTESRRQVRKGKM